MIDRNFISTKVYDNDIKESLVDGMKQAPQPVPLALVTVGF
jgi:hypothetical protein